MDLSGSPVYIRYDFQHAIENYILNMKGEKEPQGLEIKAGAIDLLSFMYSYLYRRYFENHEDIAVRDIISAIEDAHNECLQYFYYLESKDEIESVIDAEHELESARPQ